MKLAIEFCAAIALAFGLGLLIGSYRTTRKLMRIMATPIERLKK